jgi:conjugative relaxase-like TrwC/TraI family protein
VPVPTGNLVYALFQHDTSRALDPQAHVHPSSPT